MSDLTLNCVLEDLTRISKIKGKDSAKLKKQIFWNMVLASNGRVLKLFDEEFKRNLNVGAATVSKALEGRCYDAVLPKYDLTRFLILNELMMSTEGPGSNLNKVQVLKDLFNTVEDEYLKILKDVYEAKTFRIAFDQRSVLSCLKQQGVIKTTEEVRGVVGSYSIYNSYVNFVSAIKTKAVKSLVYRPMLASPYSRSSNLKGRFGAELKYDGIRLLVRKKKDSFQFWSRTGLHFDPKNFERAMPKKFMELVRNTNRSFVLDGELWSPHREAGQGFRRILPLVRTKVISDQYLAKFTFRYVVFDVLQYEDNSLLHLPYARRRRVLKSLNLDPYVVRTLKVKDTSDVQKILKRIKNTVFQGLVLKKLSDPYFPGKRTQSWLKVKHQFDTLDLLATNVYKGTGKYSNTYSALEVSARKGTEYVCLGCVGSGFSEADLVEVNRRVLAGERILIEVECQGLTKSTKYSSGYAMRFPRYVRFRDDKQDANTLDEVLSFFRI